MRKTQLLVVLSIVILSFTAANSQNKQKKNQPLFSNFIYEGKDQVYIDNPLKSDEFYTPVLQGCYPDPAITKKGDDYYMVCSSFAMFPGVPIFHSKDLVNWTDLGGVLNDVTQLVRMTQVLAREFMLRELLIILITIHSI